jgi:hypothetical protein
MMIALAIMAIALTAIFSSFSFQHKSYVTQNAVAQMQQSVRGGLAFMEEEIRNGANLPASISLANFQMPPGFFGGSTISLVSGVGISDGGLNGSDNIYVISLTGVNTTIEKAPGNSIANDSDVDVTSIDGWSAGDIGIIYDTVHASLFAVNGVQASPTRINHAGYGGLSTQDNKFVYDYASGTRIARIHYSGFSIDQTILGPNHPALVRWSLDNTGMVAEIVADDIEDMQIRLGVQDNVTGIITFRDGNWFNTNPLDLAKVRQVRIQLVGRTSIADRSWNEGPYYNTDPGTGFNRTGPITGNDNYRRRPLMRTISIRNAGFTP